VSKAFDDLNTWELEIFNKNHYDEKLAKKIMVGRHFEELTTTHLFVSQYFSYLKFQLSQVLLRQTTNSVEVFTSLSYAALGIILVC
jgi:hypothetical protein